MRESRRESPSYVPRMPRSIKCHEETLAWLTRVIRTGAGSITPEKELCQSYSVGKHGSRITMPDMGDF